MATTYQYRMRVRLLKGIMMVKAKAKPIAGMKYHYDSITFNI